MTSKPLPSLEVLSALFSYCPDTGTLTRRACSGGQAAGTPVGTKRPDGYLVVQIDGLQYRAHRVAYAIHHGRDPWPLQIDHVNRDRSDNRAANLRAVTGRQNRANSLDNSRPVEVRYPNGQVRLLPSVSAAARLLDRSPRTVRSYIQGRKPHPAGIAVAYCP